MALKIKLGQAEHDALDDSLKTLYVADGDGFRLDADYEDVTGLKKKTSELLAEQKRLKDEMKRFDGLDPEAARAAIEAAQKAVDDKLKEEGNFEAIKQQYEDRIKTAEEKAAKELEKALNEKNSILANLKRERLGNVLTEKHKVLPDRAKYLVAELEAAIELVSNEQGFSLKKIGGIGDEAEFNLMIEEVRTRSPFFFASDNIPGSGASGSNGNNNGNGNGKTITKKQYEANPLQYATQLANREISITDN